MEIVKWVDYEQYKELLKDKEHYRDWRKNAPYDADERREDPYWEFLVKYIRDNNLQITGEQHQYTEGTPVFDDGTIFSVSWRTWGRLMADAYNLWEKEGDFAYMNYYM